MSTFLYRIGKACYAARWRVIVAWVALLAVLGLAAGIGGRHFEDAFTIPGAPSQVALDELKMVFPDASGNSALVVLTVPEGQKATDADVKKAVEASADRLEKLDIVKSVRLPYNEHVKGLISDDGRSAMMTVQVTVQAATVTEAQREELQHEGALLQQALPGSEVHVGGEIFAVNMPKLSPVEFIGIGVAMVVLLVVLGSVAAAMMPLVTAVIGAALSMLLIVVASNVMTINSTTMLLALMLALAVGIDYALFIVSRHRDQLAAGMDAAESAARATGTAGSAVVFAGLTVIVALIGLAAPGLPFLTTMGAFAAVAVALEVVLALTVVPALLGLAGERLRPKPRPETRRATFDASRWWVGVVTRKPILTIVAVVLALGALALPAKDLWLALPNSGRSLPGHADRVTFDVVSERFGVGYNGPLVLTGTIATSTDPMGVINGIKADLEKTPGVKLVATAVPNANVDSMLIQVIPTTGPDDPATRDLVHRINDQAPGWQSRYGVKATVTGFTAVAIDLTERLTRALVPFGIFVIGLSLVLLAMVFRSIWVPIKAALGYVLSVAAAFGAVTLVFNQGWFKQVINLPEAVPVISFLPIILMGILFGLAMDYEVFLVSRMREEHVHGNTVNPVEEGFVHSAKVVVAAAIIMFAVFAFFVPAGEGVIKPIAFGLALGVAADAFLVRMTLGPAVMKLLGARAWWLPTWLDRALPVMDVEGEALAHQLALADWPEPGSTASIALADAATDPASPRVLPPLTASVEPGGVLVVAGDPTAREAAVYALTGRLPLTAGRAKVLGLVLPQEAAQLRRRAHLVDADALRQGRVGRPGDLVAVPDAASLPADAVDALRALVSDAEGRTFVLGVASPDAAPRLGVHPTVLRLDQRTQQTDLEPALAGGNR